MRRTLTCQQPAAHRRLAAGLCHDSRLGFPGSLRVPPLCVATGTGMLAIMMQWRVDGPWHPTGSGPADESTSATLQVTGRRPSLSRTLALAAPRRPSSFRPACQWGRPLTVTRGLRPAHAGCSALSLWAPVRCPSWRAASSTRRRRTKQQATRSFTQAASGTGTGSAGAGLGNDATARSLEGQAAFCLL
jgi:hypothetical protein